MSDEQVGFGPAALENPDNESFATKDKSLGEVSQEIPTGTEGEKTEGSGKYEKLLQSVSNPVASTGAAGDATKADLEHLQTLESEEEKIEQLVKLAHNKGLAHAVQVAGRLKDYYALDVFHDQLVDNLYDSLLKEGLITQE